MITKESYAEFTWLWNDEFFLESGDGNGIWSNPDYDGTNVIRPYDGSYADYLKEIGLSYGRCKGLHKVESYCGSEVEIKQ